MGGSSRDGAGEASLAKHAQRMVTRAGCTVDEVARALEVDRGRVRELLRIAGCGGKQMTRRGGSPRGLE